MVSVVTTNERVFGPGTRVRVNSHCFQDGIHLMGKQGTILVASPAAVSVRIDGHADTVEFAPWRLDVIPAGAAPAAPHKFRKGDRVRVTGGKFAGKSGKIFFDEPLVSVTGRNWLVELHGNHESKSRIEGIEDIHIEPAPEPPAPIPAADLHRVEYREADDDGDPLPGVAWRAALLPITGPSARDDLFDILSCLAGFEEIPGRPEPDLALIAILGGKPVPAHAPLDRVAITRGPWEGRTMFLARRDDGDDAGPGLWWLSAEPGGRAWLGLHADFFEPAGEGGGA